MTYRQKLTLALLTGAALAFSACATRPELDLMIHESARGTVYLERIPDRSFRAVHPTALSTDTMARVLRGVVVKETPGLLANLIAGTKTAPAFRNEDIEYLAPLLVEGLTRAASDQQVGFRMVKTVAPTHAQSGMVFCSSYLRTPGVCSSEQPSGTESTRGWLYVHGRSLYLTLTEYRHLTRDTADSYGSVTRTVDFIPESAKRPARDRHARATAATLVIDYDLLAALPVAPDIRSTATQPPTPAKNEAPQRDADLDELRKEMRDIKKKLAEQEAQKSTPRSTP